MAGSDREIPPDLNEIEVSLFGPGFGECILIHLGNQKWAVIDSCVDKKSKAPAALEYLKSLNIDPSSSIKLVIATHWHDDHIRGLGEIFEIAKDARFVCSAALNSEEFLTLVEQTKSLLTKSTGMREFARITQTLRTRKSSQRVESVGPEFAFANSIIFNEETGWPNEIRSLSPSQGSMNLAFQEIAGLLPSASITKRRVVAQKPNHSAIVIWGRLGEHNILLGSDLEETANPDTGWSAILDSPVKLNDKAGLFKVPHHGSKTGHQERVWNELLMENCFAILSPFTKGGLRLPKSEDIERITGLTPNAFITSNNHTGKIKGYSKTIEKTMKETAKYIREIPVSPGQIRLRLKNPEEKTSTWSLELFNPACDLKMASSL